MACSSLSSRSALERATCECGTGLTNTMFMKPGGVMIQLLPYGFTVNEATKQLIRGDYFADMIDALNGTYLQVRCMQAGWLTALCCYSSVIHIMIGFVIAQRLLP